MSDIVIRAEGLGKKYRIGASAPYHRFSELLSGLGRAGAAAVTRPFCRQIPSVPSASPADPTEFWALKDVSFEIKQGEVVGIIGRNGAGKSTLLKVLSRITEPTTGRFGVRGRVASLLEVGTGFHPELTGRENIFVSGVLLGMTRAEVKRRFDEIVAFSGVEKFLDTPVKRYSSGMQVRLGFAVAAHLESEILIIDEVLAVGDAEFQKRCLGKMGDVAQSGRTVLFVSHNMGAVRELCGSAMFLDNGTIQFHGPASKVIATYSNAAKQGNPSSDSGRRWATESISLVRAYACDLDGIEGSTFFASKGLRLVFEFDVRHRDVVLYPSLVLHGEDRYPILNSVPLDFDPIGGAKPLTPGKVRWTAEVPPVLLNEGPHFVTCYVIRDCMLLEFVVEDLLHFAIVDDLPKFGWYGKRVGAVRPPLAWTRVSACSSMDVADADYSLIPTSVPPARC